MYEVNTTQLESSLSSANSTVFTQETVNQILNLVTPTSTGSAAVEQISAASGGQVTVQAGTAIAHVALAATGTTQVEVPANLPVVIFESQTGAVNVTLHDTGPVSSTMIERVVIGAGGNDIIAVTDDKASRIDAGTGNDTVRTAGGNDVIVATAGHDSVATGGGNDTVIVGTGNDTVDGGSGFDVVTMSGSAANYQVTVQNGEMVVTGTGGQTVDLKNVQYVQLDNGEALIAAKSSSEVAVTALYEAILGRTADADGLKFWFDAADRGVSLDSIANGFVNSAEAQANQQLPDTLWLQQLYQKTFDRQQDTSGFQFWANALEHGVSRAHVAAVFAEVAADNVAGTAHTEVTTVGYVHVIGDTI